MLGAETGPSVILGDEVGELCEPLSGRVWTAATVRAQVRRRAARYEARGAAPGDLVFVHFGNTLEFFADLLALWSLGACVAPVDSRLTAFEVETLARAAAPRFSLWPAGAVGPVATGLASLGVTLLESPAARDAEWGTGLGAWPRSRLRFERDALVLFTSGSTGQPKGVVHTHRSLLARWSSLRAHVALESVARTLCLLPTHFGHGLICNALYPWLSGQRLIVLAPFRPEAALRLGALVDEHRVTFMSSVPALWRLTLRTARPPRAGTLRRVFCGSAPLSASMWRDIREWTGGASVSNVYGITETASWLAGSSPETEPEDGLVGEPWGACIAVVSGADGAAPPGTGRACQPGETGHVWVRTPALMRGYLGRDDLTAAAVRDGWLATGDTGCLDGRGRLHLRGRIREEINRGGTKVHPADVDAVVERFEQATDACAFGYDDGLGHEDVGVAVVLPSGNLETVRRLYAWTRRHLAAHQMPRRWYVVDEIPRTASGKVNRAQVAARCAGLPPVDPRAFRPEGADDDRHA
ncbi:MAG TPA: long-chain fatty acid--CoA ligase [Methylomirabilota bacterium]|nr:long-chain fatty acid--CoA ligase [Methylomirabilota bacterium]